MTNTPAPPRLDRPQFHVWMCPDDLDPDAATEEQLHYIGVVTITNSDQLTAERQGRANGVTDAKSMPFHLTVLWLHAAMARTGRTSLRFQEFSRRLEYRPADRERAGEEDDGLDPSTTDQGVSTP